MAGSELSAACVACQKKDAVSRGGRGGEARGRRTTVAAAAVYRGGQGLLQSGHEVTGSLRGRERGGAHRRATARVSGGREGPRRLTAVSGIAATLGGPVICAAVTVGAALNCGLTSSGVRKVRRGHACTAATGPPLSGLTLRSRYGRGRATGAALMAVRLLRIGGAAKREVAVRRGSHSRRKRAAAARQRIRHGLARYCLRGGRPTLFRVSGR